MVGFMLLAVYLLAFFETGNANSQDQIVLNQGDLDFYIEVSSKPPGKYPSTGGSTLLNFDDIDLPSPKEDIYKYKFLDFIGFQVFNPIAAYRGGLTSIFDDNCATSSPNALMGSRSISPPTIPRFYASELFPAATTSNSGYFTLDAFSIKAMGYIPVGLTITITGLEIVDGRAVNSSGVFLRYFRGGYGDVGRIDFKGSQWWRNRINAVEVHAESTQGTDWEFCMDDIETSYV